MGLSVCEAIWFSVLRVAGINAKLSGLKGINASIESHYIQV